MSEVGSVSLHGSDDDDSDDEGVRFRSRAATKKFVLIEPCTHLTCRCLVQDGPDLQIDVVTPTSFVGFVVLTARGTCRCFILHQSQTTMQDADVNIKALATKIVVEVQRRTRVPFRVSVP